MSDKIFNIGMLLFAVACIVIFGLILVSSHNRKAQMEGKYCLVHEGDAIESQCVTAKQVQFEAR